MYRRVHLLYLFPTYSASSPHSVQEINIQTIRTESPLSAVLMTVYERERVIRPGDALHAAASHDEWSCSVAPLACEPVSWIRPSRRRPQPPHLQPAWLWLLSFVPSSSSSPYSTSDNDSMADISWRFPLPSCSLLTVFQASPLCRCSRLPLLHMLALSPLIFRLRLPSISGLLSPCASWALCFTLALGIPFVLCVMFLAHSNSLS